LKCGQLIIRKIFKLVATRCQIFSLKCAKFNFGWGPLMELTILSARPSSWI